jgi:hypothetical protein
LPSDEGGRFGVGLGRLLNTTPVAAAERTEGGGVGLGRSKMSKRKVRKVNRKKANVIDGKNPKNPSASSPKPNRAADLPNVNGSSHGQRTSPTNAEEFTAALFLWPLDVMRWWMPRTGS